MLHTLIFVINLKSTLNSMPMLILNCDGLWLQYILTKYIACYGLYLIHIIHVCLANVKWKKSNIKILVKQYAIYIKNL